jgi:AraC-like DNA-binding protein
MDDEELLAAFAELLDERIAGGAARLNLGEIAVQLKMGESQLRHRIQNLTGKNVSAYVTQLRMEKAMRLLHENPTMLIGDIAEQCGFSDVAYFSRVFRQYYKMTPTRARNGSPD